MNAKDREFLNAKIDPIHEGVNEIKKTLEVLGARVTKVEVKQGESRWHDWAIKGGITGLAGLLIDAVYQHFKH